MKDFWTSFVFNFIYFLNISTGISVDSHVPNSLIFESEWARCSTDWLICLQDLIDLYVTCSMISIWAELICSLRTPYMVNFYSGLVLCRVYSVGRFDRLQNYFWFIQRFCSLFFSRNRNFLNFFVKSLINSFELIIHNFH